jgi:hypothetical protein
MASDIIVKLECKRRYLIQFLEGIYGPMPIVFTKKHYFASALEILLEIPPHDFRECKSGPGILEIRLPHMEFKNENSYYYLSRAKQESFENKIYRHFKVVFHAEITRLLQTGFERNEAIALFMEHYNMDASCEEMLKKDYQRFIDMRRLHKFRKKGK